MAVFSSAPYGATAERQIQNRIFGQFCASFANYAPIWTLFSPSLTGLDFLCNALNVTQFVGRWRQKIRRFGVEIFQKGNNRTQTLCQTLRMKGIRLLHLSEAAAAEHQHRVRETDRRISVMLMQTAHTARTTSRTTSQRSPAARRTSMMLRCLVADRRSQC